MGRLPVHAALNTLSDEALRQILIEPKNALIRQYQKLFAMDNIDLFFDDDAIDAIVEQAKKLGTGARGLRSVTERIMLEIMYNIHMRPKAGQCTILRETVLDGAEPRYIKRKATA